MNGRSDTHAWEQLSSAHHVPNSAPTRAQHSGATTAQSASENLNISKVSLKVLLWNVRGINAAKKQRYLDWLISARKPDVVMFNETKLTSPLYLNGYTSRQTMLKRSGGCITFSNLKGNRKVKALSTYLNWTKVQLGGE